MTSRIVSLLPLLVFFIMLGMRVWDPILIQQMRMMVFDSYQRIDPRRYDPALPVKIVDIDDASKAKLGQWPWPRSVIAALVERLGSAGAAAIAFDNVFSEPDRSSPEQALQLWPATAEVLALRNSVDALPTHDNLLADAMKGAPVVTGFILTQTPSEAVAESMSPTAQEGRDKEKTVARTPPGISTRPTTRSGFAIGGDDPRAFIPGFSNSIANLPVIEKASRGNGALNWIYDHDRIVRRLPLVLRLNDILYPSLLAEALRVAQGAHTNFIKASGASGVESFGEKTGIDVVRIGQFEIPTDANGRIWGRFTKHEKARYISAWKVLENDFDPELVAGQIVFIGSSTLGSNNFRSTPLEEAIPRVEIQAQIVEQVIANDYLTRPDFADAAELTYMVLLGALLLSMLNRLGAIMGLIIAGGAIVFVFGGSWIAFDWYSLMFDPIQPSLLIGAVFLTAQGVSYLRSETERVLADRTSRAKSAFLATMSHEIRTPMNGVVGMIDLLYRSSLTTDQRQILSTARESAFTLLRLIDDVLDFSKIEVGMMELERAPLSVPDVIEGVAETLAPNAGKKGVRLQLDIDPGIPRHLLGDQVRLRQILFNLAGNAIKFTDAGDGRIGRVGIGVRRCGVREDRQIDLEFDVIDNGIGMDEATVAKLFTPFTQADASTTRRFGGTGLGLSICRTLTELMGGEISVTSTPGVGSSFVVRVPFEAAPEAGREEDTSVLAGVRVRVSSDEVELARIVQKHLEHAGCRFEPETDPSPCRDDDEALLCIDVVGEPGEGTSGPGRVLLRDALSSTLAAPEDGARIVSAYPLKPSALLHAIAAAAGRDSGSPRSEQASDKLAIQPPPTPEQAAAEGRLVLVAEDNLTNQDVLRRQLGLLGYATEVVANGREALEALSAERHGLLLTDCHMPEMDGYQLTRRIRAAEAGTGRRLPIVAITASVLADEVAKTLEAGMDGYLSKPVEMDRLAETLEQWLPRAGQPRLDRTAEPAEVAVAPPADLGPLPSIDEQALKDVFGSDPATFREILGEFIFPARSNVGDILAACECRDASAVAAACHKLKSSAKAVGAYQLAELCVSLEKAGAAADWETIDQNCPQLSTAFEAVEHYIDNL